MKKKCKKFMNLHHLFTWFNPSNKITFLWSNLLKGIIKKRKNKLKTIYFLSLYIVWMNYDSTKSCQSHAYLGAKNTFIFLQWMIPSYDGKLLRQAMFTSWLFGARNTFFKWMPPSYEHMSVQLFAYRAISMSNVSLHLNFLVS